MKFFKASLLSLIGVCFGIVPVLAQTLPLEYDFGLSDAQYADLINATTQTAPLSDTNMPTVGMFYSLQNPAWLPTPGNFFNLPAWDLGHRIYLVATSIFSRNRGLAIATRMICRRHLADGAPTVAAVRPMDLSIPSIPTAFGSS
jgi:hypothetical protein